MKGGNMPSKTGWLVIVLAFVMLIWEMYVILSGSGTTISEEFWQLNDRTIIVAFISGLLCGHFFWARRG